MESHNRASISHRPRPALASPFSLLISPCSSASRSRGHQDRADVIMDLKLSEPRECRRPER
jgi:hypothetical protein